MQKRRGLCPEAACKADDPVQVLIDPHLAEAAGLPELGNAVRCLGCETVWRVEGGVKRILGRFAGKDMAASGWRPADRGEA